MKYIAIIDESELSEETINDITGTVFIGDIGYYDNPYCLNIVSIKKAPEPMENDMVGVDGFYGGYNKALEDCGVLASEEQPSVTPTGTETATESEEAKDAITVLQTLREDVIKYRDNKANDFNFLIGLIFEIAAINGVIHIIDKLIAEIKNK